LGEKNFPRNINKKKKLIKAYRNFWIAADMLKGGKDWE